MTAIAELELDAGTLEFSEGDGMTATGLLVPFGEECKSNLGRFTVEPDSFTVPADLTGASLNIEHTREDVVGGLTKVETTDKGLVATFSFADTEEGRAAYADAKSGKRRHLSAEVASVVIRGGKAVAGRLFAAALVRRPAFPSATLLAAAPDTEPEPEDTASAPAEDTDAAPEVDAADTKEDAVTTAIVPDTLQASAPTEPKPLTKGEVFSYLAAIHSGTATDTMLAALRENSGPVAGSLFAALNDVKYDGTGGLTTSIQLPQWIGQVWDGVAYQQKYAPLFGHKDLTGLKISGVKWGTKPQGGTWAGNKSNVPSNAPTMQAVTADALRFAGGHDLAREFRDLQAFGDTTFFESYYAAMAESYARWVDNTVVLAQALAAATTSAADNPAGFEIGAGLSAIVDGAAKVIGADAVPSFAVVESSLWKSIIKAARNDVIGYLNAQLGLKEGTLEGFRLLASDDLATGNVLVGAKEAADVYELPGVPIRVEAPDMVKGGIDTGIFGYAALFVNKADALQLITPYTAG